MRSDAVLFLTVECGIMQTCLRIDIFFFGIKACKSKLAYMFKLLLEFCFSILYNTICH